MSEKDIAGVEKCTKLKDVLVDVKVEASFDNVWEVEYANRKLYRGDGTIGDVEKALKYAVKEFNDFLRDHRSQDMIDLTVKRIEKDICSSCEKEWEADEEDGVVYCANCGAILEGVKNGN